MAPQAARLRLQHLDSRVTPECSSGHMQPRAAMWSSGIRAYSPPIVGPAGPPSRLTATSWEEAKSRGLELCIQISLRQYLSRSHLSKPPLALFALLQLDMTSLWTKEELELLQQLVAQNSTSGRGVRWREVSQQFNAKFPSALRTPNTLALRYKKYLHSEKVPVSVAIQDGRSAILMSDSV